MAETTSRAGPRRGGGWLLAGGYARHPGGAVRLVAGCVVLLMTALAIHKNHVGSRETAVFRLVNGLALPGWTWPGVWLVMQLGSVIRKHVRDAGDAPADFSYWRREPLAYACGLLAGLNGVAAPRCFAQTEDAVFGPETGVGREPFRRIACRRSGRAGEVLKWS